MSKDIIEKKQGDIIGAMNSFVSEVPLENLSMQYNEKTKTASISGQLRGVLYTTTLKAIPDGVIKTTTQIDVSAGKDVLIQQAIDLKKQGYTQKQIAEMLGVSQATISNYLRKKV